MIVKIGLPLILAFIMFSLGLGLRKTDFTRILRYPRAFLTGAACQLLLLPAFAFGLVTAFSFPPDIAVGVMILSFCPGGVTSNVLTRLSNGNTPLSISLTAVTSLAAIVTVPVLVALSVGHFMGKDAPDVDILALGMTMFLITAVPVALGMLVTALAPQLVAGISGAVSRTAMILFFVIIVAALASNWAVFSGNLPNLGPALVLLNIGMLAIGLAASRVMGLGSEDASTVSIEAGVQNGTLGIAVGSLVALGSSEALPPTTVPSAVYSIIMYLVTIPFVVWRRRVRG
ncbi:bile acid:sodium symporter family protein [Akkermansiaceae bacterium]|nr:bile acid:sodium symporter family protein [Akkermansiaceae bacterium]